MNDVFLNIFKREGDYHAMHFVSPARSMPDLRSMTRKKDTDFGISEGKRQKGFLIVVLEVLLSYE